MAERADIKKGPIFWAIDRWEAAEDKALTPQSINLIVKRRCAMAGLEPEAFSAHGLRAGYLTEAARQGIALPEAMQQSQHRSVQQAASYYNEAERAQGRAARLGSSDGLWLSLRCGTHSRLLDSRAEQEEPRLTQRDKRKICTEKTPQSTPITTLTSR